MKGNTMNFKLFLVVIFSSSLGSFFLASGFVCANGLNKIILFVLGVLVFFWCLIFSFMAVVSKAKEEVLSVVKGKEPKEKESYRPVHSWD